MSEEKTVFLLGAGANRSITNFERLQPPLIKDFFTQFLNCRMFQTYEYLKFIKPLFNWIEDYWKKSKADLKIKEDILSIEDVFSIIQVNIESAILNNDRINRKKFTELNFISKAILVEFLNQFDVFSSYAKNLRKFGDLLYKVKPDIITFNYDNFIEGVIEGASKLRMVVPRYKMENLYDFKFVIPKKPEDLIKDDYNLSPFNWNCALSYGFKFDKLSVRIRGVEVSLPKEEYYSHPENRLSDFKILKLHRSLNWFKYQSYRNNPLGEEDIKLIDSQKKQIIFGDANWFYNLRPNLDGIILDPLIITPVLHKVVFYKSFPFNIIWKQAREKLQKCKELIIIGYSFSPTDFYSKKLLLDAFMNNQLKELIIVNPDHSIAEKVKDLTHFEKDPKIYNNLSEFLKNNSEI